MRYAKIDKCEYLNGTGVGVALFVQGCSKHCKGCFNPETWDFNGGKEWTQETEDRFLKLLDKPYITRVTILGGEPLATENIPEVYKLMCRIKEMYPQKKVWLYTGFTLTLESLNGLYEIIELCDYIVDGRYIHELRNQSLPFRGSSNQRIIDAKKTLKEGNIILYEFN